MEDGGRLGRIGGRGDVAHLLVLDGGQDARGERVRVIEVQRAVEPGAQVGVVLVGIVEVVDDLAVEREIEHVPGQLRGEVQDGVISLRQSLRLSALLLKMLSS